MNENKEVVITKYNEQKEVELIAINNMRKRAVEFYKCTPISFEEAEDLINNKN